MNLVFITYVGYKVLVKLSNDTVKNKLLKEQREKIFQPRSPNYFLERNELFSILPSDSNETVMLGTSHTQNFEWNEFFEKENIKNRAIYGDISKGILFRLDDVLKNKPKKLFLEIGSNDIFRGYHIDSVILNYENILEKINTQSPETKVYVQNLFPAKRNIDFTYLPVIDSIKKFNVHLKMLCEENSVTYIDLFSFYNNEDEIVKNKLFIDDKVHLSKTGYEKWCEVISDYIFE